MTLSKYFWDLNAPALRETKQAIKNPGHPQFPQRMVTLLSRCDKPKELFSIVSREKFLRAWPRIRSHWIKKERNSPQRDWWETIVDQLMELKNKKSLGTKGAPSVSFKRLGDTIREKRIQMELSQKQLALRTGLKQPVISQIEDGRNNPTLFTVIRLCKALGIETIDLRG